jgi:hypothetical protein
MGVLEGDVAEGDSCGGVVGEGRVHWGEGRAVEDWDGGEGEEGDVLTL